MAIGKTTTIGRRRDVCDHLLLLCKSLVDLRGMKMDLVLLSLSSHNKTVESQLAELSRSLNVGTSGVDKSKNVESISRLFFVVSSCSLSLSGTMSGSNGRPSFCKLLIITTTG